MSSRPGAVIVRADVVGTVVFGASAVVAAVVFSGAAKVQGVVVALALFAVGVFTFLWGYWTAVQRSRYEQIAVSQVYFLTGGVVGRAERRTMMLAFVAQCVIGLVTALSRPSTPDVGGSTTGSTLAFGILVPMFGLGLNGLLAARHGTFAERPNPGVPPADGAIGKNAGHD
jgi:hypothetical protein